jgi:hypothetical protein
MLTQKSARFEKELEIISSKLEMEEKRQMAMNKIIEMESHHPLK